MFLFTRTKSINLFHHKPWAQSKINENVIHQELK